MGMTGWNLYREELEKKKTETKKPEVVEKPKVEKVVESAPIVEETPKTTAPKKGRKPTE